MKQGQPSVTLKCWETKTNETVNKTRNESTQVLLTLQELFAMVLKKSSEQESQTAHYLSAIWMTKYTVVDHAEIVIE